MLYKLTVFCHEVAKHLKGCFVILSINHVADEIQSVLRYVNVVFDVHDLTLTCRSDSKTSDILKIVDVPSKRLNLRLNFIEDDMCIFVFFVIDQDRKGTGKFIDALCVVGQCHGIAPKNKLKGVGAAALDVRNLEQNTNRYAAARYESTGIEKRRGLP